MMQLGDVDFLSFSRVCKSWRSYFGSTCGYLIFYGRETKDFWVVNPITRHELHFPHVPSHVYSGEFEFHGILVFSSSISRWVFVISRIFTCGIWSSIAGKGELKL
uniref:F-box domain-containing protein n=1 Tax=Lactuca sativa TaxID=4236 RepID=A0A9R1XCU1_LACSA|nr:hypothetical protein LSAT_V11C500256900 [Lactuca sativa]